MVVEGTDKEQTRLEDLSRAELEQRVRELQARQRLAGWATAAEEMPQRIVQQLAGIMEHSPDLMMLLDVQGRYLMANQALAALLGVEVEDIVGKPCADLLPSDVAYLVLDQLNQVVGTGAPLKVEETLFVDNDERPYRMTMFPVFDRQGDVCAVGGVATDVTTRRQAEASLRKSENRFRTIVDTVPQLIAYTDRDLTYRFVNRAYQEKFGVEPDQVIGKSLPEVIGAAAFEKARPHVEQALGGEPVRYHERYEYTIGGTRDIDGVLVPDLAEDGEVRGYYAVLTDITPYMEMQEALRKSEARYRELYDDAPIAYFTVGTDGLILQANKRAVAMLGYALEDLLGRPVLDLYADTPAGKRRAHEVFHRFLVGRATYDEELQMRRADGTPMWVSLTVQPVWSEDGEIVETRSMAMDITMRKQTEEALRDSQALFFKAFDTELVAMGISRRRDGMYLEANPGFLRMTGYAYDEIVGRTSRELNFFSAEQRQALVDGLSEQGSLHNQELTFPTKSGALRTVLYSIGPITLGDEDCLLATMVDVTGRKEAQEELRRYAERMKIQHDVDTAILAARSPEEIVRVALTRLVDIIPCLRASIAEIDAPNQRTRELIVLPGEGKKHARRWYPLSNTGSLVRKMEQGRIHRVPDIEALESLSHLEQMVQRVGARAYISVPLMTQGDLVGTLNLISETPRYFQPEHEEILQEVADSLAIALQQARLLDQAQRDAETKALLLREVNHRAKNNLDAIIGLLYVERRHAPPEALPAYSRIMEDLTLRIMGLAQVHHLLSEAGWKPLLLSELAEYIIQSAVRAASHQVPVTLEVEPAPVYVTPNQAHHLALVISELATNTLKYASAGQKEIYVSVHVVQEGDRITFSYRNNGPGYPPEVLRLEHYSAGLDIVRRIVDKNLRGDLILRNEDGAVTEIRFRVE